MKFKALFFLFILIIYSNSILSQKLVSYHYSVFNSLTLDTPNISDEQKEFNFNSLREYSNNNTFKDSHIFCSSNDNSCSTEFMVKNNKWYIKSNKKWVLFFDKEIRTINNFKKNTDLIGQELKVIKNVILYGFVLKNTKKNSRISSYNLYWFNPKYGIIAIENSELVLVRDDVFNTR